jgi:AcrR family transcriptional regulator
VSSREALEEVAFDLLLRDGYEKTTIQAIMAAGEVGRTTFFRYFGSKGGIVWGEFDRAVERLQASLDRAGDGPVTAAVIGAVAESTRLSRQAAPDTWLDRFRVLDEDPALSGVTAEHWRVWADAITGFVSARMRADAGSIVPVVIGGAIQAAYVAVLRRWAHSDATAVDIAELARELHPIGEALERLIA